MIKFKAASGRRGRELVGFGITEKNVENLKKGNPIFIMAEEMNLPFDVTIFYGKDENTIASDLRKAGYIDPEHTVIHKTPRSRS
jgi:hypothetical protein